MNFAVISLSIICFGHSVYSQKTKESRLSKFDMLMSDNIERNEGSVFLKNGEALQGLLSYNDKSGVLKYEYGNDSRSFIARNVLGFEIYDPDFDGNRVFYSIEYVGEYEDTSRPYFFELIRDFKSFAVLVRKSPLNIRAGKNFGTTNNDVAAIGNGTSKKMIIEQIETIYFIRPQEDPQPYFSKIVKNGANKSIFETSNTRRKFIDKDLMEEYVGERYEQLKEFANDNNLSFKEKSDFLKILEFYETLLD